MIADDFDAVLNGAGGERLAARFLKKNPVLVLWSFVRTGGHSKYVLTEFPIGIKYRADFVVVFSYSGAWDVYLIELEPVKDPIITKAGLVSKRLNSAISQINDWAEYVERNRPQVQQDLSDWCMKHDLLGWHSTDDGPPSNYTSDYLKDPETFIHFHYYIIIGRRGTATAEKRRKMNQYQRSGSYMIGTYDRFLDVARNIDYHHTHPNASVYLADIKE
jgi:hypothetical protein